MVQYAPAGVGRHFIAVGLELTPDSLLMPGTLHVVATPIGNLEDVTLRALAVLRAVAVIAAEDTRRTARLLARYGVSTPCLSYHEHNTRSRQPQLLERLRSGADIALVTDAGTPGVSDPGAELVRACVSEGIPVNPVPGVSAPLTAAVASGFPLVPFSIYGFAPGRSKDRIRWLRDLATVPHTFTFFESPNRIADTLAEIPPIWGDRPIMLARELTKAHQELLRGSAKAILTRLRSTKGEFTIVVGPALVVDSAPVVLSDLELSIEFGGMTNTGRSGRREAVSALAKRYGLPAREVYAAIERGKKSGV
jgi:16S rRNA (cytidine1402-2'-O)-methyltransferase